MFYYVLFSLLRSRFVLQIFLVETTFDSLWSVRRAHSKNSVIGNQANCRSLSHEHGGSRTKGQDAVWSGSARSQTICSAAPLSDTPYVGLKRINTYLPWIVAGALFVATFGLSGYWIVTNPQQPLPDPTLYEGIGANLAAGNGYSFDVHPPYRPELTRTPFLPHLIALLYQFTGRHPGAVLWMNAVFIGMAVALGYLFALRLFEKQAIAITGGIIAFLTPPVTGAANNILTEPPAMLQLVVAAFLLTDWSKRVAGRWAPLHGTLLGLLFASITLNRTALTPVVLIAAAYIAVVALRGHLKNSIRWLTVGLFCLSLGTPVVAWAARNASLGLAFSPAPIGIYASRILDIKRYREHLLDKGEKLPRVNKQYFLHWKRHYGPERLKELEAANKAWFEAWRAEHGKRILKSIPHRLLGLFSYFRNSIFPPWPGHKDRENREKMRWVARSLWLLAFVGLILSWKNRWARYFFIVPVVGLVAVHVPTVCHHRYTFPVLPLLMPYGGVTLYAVWRATFGRLRKSHDTDNPN